MKYKNNKFIRAMEYSIFEFTFPILTSLFVKIMFMFIAMGAIMTWTFAAVYIKKYNPTAALQSMAMILLFGYSIIGLILIIVATSVRKQIQNGKIKKD